MYIFVSFFPCTPEVCHLINTIPYRFQLLLLLTKTTLELGTSKEVWCTKQEYQRLGTSMVPIWHVCSGKWDVKGYLDKEFSWRPSFFAIGDWTIDIFAESWSFSNRKFSSSKIHLSWPPDPPLHPWQWPMHRNGPPRWMVRQQHRHPTREPGTRVVWPSMTGCLGGRWWYLWYYLSHDIHTTICCWLLVYARLDPEILQSSSWKGNLIRIEGMSTKPVQAFFRKLLRLLIYSCPVWFRFTRLPCHDFKGKYIEKWWCYHAIWQGDKTRQQQTCLHIDIDSIQFQYLSHNCRSSKEKMMVLQQPKESCSPKGAPAYLWAGNHPAAHGF